jgi:NAD(P)H-dependent FMN reductase
MRLLLVSGSTRSHSSNTAVLRVASGVAKGLATCVLWEGLAQLPAFVPGADTEQPASVVDWLELVSLSDAILFAAPEYAGGLPGSLKNALDWTVGGGELSGKPVAWVNVADHGRGGGVEAALRSVLSHVGAVVVEEACRRIALSPASGEAVQHDIGVRRELRQVIAAMVTAVSVPDLHDVGS